MTELHIGTTCCRLPVTEPPGCALSTRAWEAGAVTVHAVITCSVHTQTGCKRSGEGVQGLEISMGARNHGGWGLCPPQPTAVHQSWVKLRVTSISQSASGSLGGLTIPPGGGLLVLSGSSMYLCVDVEKEVVCDVVKEAKEPNCQLLCGWRC